MALTCPHCGTEFDPPRGRVGEAIVCGACGRDFSVDVTETSREIALLDLSARLDMGGAGPPSWPFRRVTMAAAAALTALVVAFTVLGAIYGYSSVNMVFLIALGLFFLVCLHYVFRFCGMAIKYLEGLGKSLGDPDRR
ncbi:MAG: hypothetical protein LBQ79_02725 [Deltaproteobacteria bacterium]|jgi:hypothetical protein|nr:hypothetical protein [Deltaproteobacteria bacterium]